MLSFYVIRYLASKINDKHLWMGIIASQVSDSCSETLLNVSTCTECYVISLVQLLFRDHLILVAYNFVLCRVVFD